MKTLLATVLLLCGFSLHAATTLVADNDYATVLAAYNASSDGDTILLTNRNSAGGPHAYWTNYIDVAKMVTFQGMGSNDTVLVDEAVSRSSPIFFNVSATNTAGIFRFTGIRFLPGGTNGLTQNIVGAFQIATASPRWRVDRCWFDHLNSRPAYFLSGGAGLWDHNLHSNVRQSGFYIRQATANTDRGNSIWSTNVAWGQQHIGPTIENNVFYDTNGTLRAFTDGDAGGVIIARYNTMTNLTLETHEQGQAYRGLRWFEFYMNYMIKTTTAGVGKEPHLIRSGSGVVFSNTYAGNYTRIGELVYYRLMDSFSSWGQANGTNTWDTNNSTLFLSGTHDGTIDGTNALVDTSKSWTTDEWVGYSVQNVESGRSGAIYANTATTLTVQTPLTAGSRPIWTNGNTYRIYKIIQALDQPGVGAGDLVKVISEAAGSTNTVLGGPTYPRHGYDPIWFWGNTYNTWSVDRGFTGIILAGRNYTNAVRTNYTSFTYPHPLATEIDGSGTSAIVPALIAPGGPKRIGGGF